MPKNSRAKSSGDPPPVMTWGKAAPVLILAVVFDALRFMFEWFIFFGPAAAAAVCTAAVSSGNTLATTLGGIGCTAAATAGGIAAAPVFETFGIIMAMIAGFIGWLVIGAILLRGNARIFKENFLWFAGSLLVSEVPFVGSVPAITLILWRMYANQIKQEKADLKRYEEARATEQRQSQSQAAALEQQAVNTAAYEAAAAQQEAESGEEEIPEGDRVAA